eukprot:3038229-Rhodomonas_salina.1
MLCTSGSGFPHCARFAWNHWFVLNFQSLSDLASWCAKCGSILRLERTGRSSRCKLQFNLKSRSLEPPAAECHDAVSSG